MVAREDIVDMSVTAEMGWRLFLEENGFDEEHPSGSKLSDFYNVFSKDYAVRVGYSADVSYRLTVHEILRGGQRSARFVLMNEPSVAELLAHYVLLVGEDSSVFSGGSVSELFGSDVDFSSWSVGASFAGDHKVLGALWNVDDGFVRGLMLSRSLGSYEKFADMVTLCDRQLADFSRDGDYMVDQGWMTLGMS